MRFLRLLIFMLALSAFGADRITVSVIFTNAPTTNGMTFVLNSSTRTWTNNVQASSIQVLTNSTVAGCKTNMFNQVALNPFANVQLINRGSTNFDLVGSSGTAMSATVSGFWGYVTYATQTVSTLTAVRVPVSGEATANVRTNVASGLVDAIETYSTNSLNQNSFAASELVGLTNAQSISGAKAFTNRATHLVMGALSATNISGRAVAITNGNFKTNIFEYPKLTNGVNYGSAFSSPGSGNASEQFGNGSTASGELATAIGSANASGISSIAVGVGAGASADFTVSIGVSSSAVTEGGTALGYFAESSAINATALGKGATAAFDNSTAVGNGATSTDTNQVALGSGTGHVLVPNMLKVAGSIQNSHFLGTNLFQAESDISFARYANTSLANGNNAAVLVGTNVFVQVSGPSGAFAINGLDGAPNRDGKLVILLNYTGQNMTIAHDSGVDPTAGNRIYTMTGADHSTTGNGCAMLIYSASAARWILINLQE